MYCWKTEIDWTQVLWPAPSGLWVPGLALGQTFSYITARSSQRHIWYQLFSIGTGSTALFPGPTACISTAPEALGRSFSTDLRGVETAAPTVLLFLLMQKHDAPLICKTAARESLVLYRTRSDLSFPEREVVPRCSPRHCRQQLESITSDKEQASRAYCQVSHRCDWKTAEAVRYLLTAVHRLDLFLKGQLGCCQCLAKTAEWEEESLQRRDGPGHRSH